MEKKHNKIEEPQASYAVQKPEMASADQSGPRYASLEKVKATNAKLMAVHHEVLKKLAQ